MDNIVHIKDRLILVDADMRDGHSLSGAVESSAPDYIFHLASQSFVPMSWRAPADTMETNYVGNLDARRDFTDVRDIVKAYWLAVTNGEYGEVYNICSGETRTIQSVLDLLLAMTDKKIEIKQDPSRMRPSDVEVLHGDCSKFKKQTGWKPEIPFEKTMSDLLNYWRERV
jgi:GDP-D-mannose dehydratase